MLDQDYFKKLTGGARLSRSQRELAKLEIENAALWDIVSVLVARSPEGIAEVREEDMARHRAPGMRCRVWNHKDGNGDVLLLPGVKAEAAPATS